MRFLFRRRNRLHARLFITRSAMLSNPSLHGLNPTQSAPGVSTAGFGVAGPLGPRTGNSSGILPGNSCGGGEAPGSRIGGGTSGLGLLGGSSRGGSVGCPGVAGGISGGSIGIYSATLRLSPISGRVPVTAAAAIFT